MLEVGDLHSHLYSVIWWSSVTQLLEDLLILNESFIEFQWLIIYAASWHFRIIKTASFLGTFDLKVHLD